MVNDPLGFGSEDLTTLFGSNEQQMSKYEAIDEYFVPMGTNLSGVFATGDIDRGAALVV